jgi:ribosomal protein S27E
MPAVPRPALSFQGKGEKSMRVKCLSCGNELNLDHWVFEDYEGPLKCFSCAAMMEVKSTGGEIYSINALAVYEKARKAFSPTEDRI